MQEKWEVQDRWHVSPYNFAKEVRSTYKDMPEQVSIRDVTLSEGQHQPGVHYSLESMMRIAHALRHIGIREIKQNAADFQVAEFITRAKREIPDIIICLILPIFDEKRYRRSLSIAKQDLDRFIDMGIDEVNYPCILSWSCPTSVAKAFSREARLDSIAEMTQYARSRGIGVELGHADATRAGFEDLKAFFDAGLIAGMTKIGVYDSYGVASPDGMKYLVSRLRKEYPDMDILSHAHNDFGSASANTIAGILGGATSCDLSVNGLGDRAGNASFEEVVLQLEAFYGIRTGVNLEELLALCRMVEEVTGFHVQDYKPVSGKNVFTHESEAHASMIIEEGVAVGYAAKSEAFSPKAVGAKRNVKFGGTSLAGGMIAQRMSQIGLTFSEDQVAEVSGRIKKIFTEQKRDISLDEFDSLAEEVCASNNPK